MEGQQQKKQILVDKIATIMEQDIEDSKKWEGIRAAIKTEDSRSATRTNFYEKSRENTPTRPNSQSSHGFKYFKGLDRATQTDEQDLLKMDKIEPVFPNASDSDTSSYVASRPLSTFSKSRQGSRGTNFGSRADSRLGYRLAAKTDEGDNNKVDEKAEEMSMTQEVAPDINSDPKAYLAAKEKEFERKLLRQKEEILRKKKEDNKLRRIMGKERIMSREGDRDNASVDVNDIGGFAIHQDDAVVDSMDQFNGVEENGVQPNLRDDTKQTTERRRDNAASESKERSTGKTMLTGGKTHTTKGRSTRVSPDKKKNFYESDGEIVQKKKRLRKETEAFGLKKREKVVLKVWKPQPKENKTSRSPPHRFDEGGKKNFSRSVSGSNSPREAQNIRNKHEPPIRNQSQPHARQEFEDSDSYDERHGNEPPYLVERRREIARRKKLREQLREKRTKQAETSLEEAQSSSIQDVPSYMRPKVGKKPQRNRSQNTSVDHLRSEASIRAKRSLIEAGETSPAAIKDTDESMKKRLVKLNSLPTLQRKDENAEKKVELPPLKNSTLEQPKPEDQTQTQTQTQTQIPAEQQPRRKFVHIHRSGIDESSSLSSDSDDNKQFSAIPEQLDEHNPEKVSFYRKPFVEETDEALYHLKKYLRMNRLDKEKETEIVRLVTFILTHLELDKIRDLIGLLNILKASFSRPELSVIRELQSLAIRIANDMIQRDNQYRRASISPYKTNVLITQSIPVQLERPMLKEPNVRSLSYADLFFSNKYYKHNPHPDENAVHRILGAPTKFDKFVDGTKTDRPEIPPDQKILAQRVKVHRSSHDVNINTPLLRRLYVHLIEDEKIKETFVEKLKETMKPKFNHNKKARDKKDLFSEEKLDQMLESFDLFLTYYSKILRQHHKCGDFCLHEKQFFKKINFNPVVMDKNLVNMQQPFKLLELAK